MCAQAQREYGNKWRTIVDNYLPWRSPNDLKNYCNQYVNGKHNHVRTVQACARTAVLLLGCDVLCYATRR
jgi:hypothetical protein